MVIKELIKVATENEIMLNMSRTLRLDSELLL